MEENNLMPNVASNIILNNDAKKSDGIKKELSDWQIYQLAINWCAFFVELKYDINDTLIIYSPLALTSQYFLKKNYSYEAFAKNGGLLWLIGMGNDAYSKLPQLQKNKIVKWFVCSFFMRTKYLHSILQIMSNYDGYFFTQGPSSISLHVDSLETEDYKNVVIADFYRDELDNDINKKRIASRYQTLSFYDYDYFYQEKAPDETAVDFWLAMDRFLEEPYLTQKEIKQNNPNKQLSKEDIVENVDNKDKLRNYVHRIMIVPDKLLNDDEKRFRAWVKDPENQKKFIKIYKKTFNRVSETGLKKIEGNIEDQKESIKSKLLFCKQKMTFKNLNGEQETKFVYSLKLLNNGRWIEYLKNKCGKYSEVSVYDPIKKEYDTKYLTYESNKEEDLYEFPNMEYLTYLLHADPNELKAIEKEFVNAFLDRSNSGSFSLSVQMHNAKDVKQYFHDNLITGRKNWKLKRDKNDNSVENGLSDSDIKILDILNNDKRIARFNEDFDKIYNENLVKHLYSKAISKYGKKPDLKKTDLDPIDKDFDAPTDKPEQYDLEQEFYKIVNLCNKKGMQDKNKLPETVTVALTFIWSKFFKGLVISFVISLAIFIALKFIFDVAIWALIVFSVASVLIFFAYVFLLKDRYTKITYLNNISTFEDENEEESVLSQDEIENENENEIKIGEEEIKQESVEEEINKLK